MLGRSDALRRLIDVGVSFISIILSSPLFLLIAVMTKLGTRGSVLFRQERVGLGEKRFTIYKFRSMPESRTAFLQEGRPPKKEASRVGRFLRGPGLDELPQLVNVLRGDMSLVGPRPLIPEELYCQDELRYLVRNRCRVRPGMTGLWQITNREKGAVPPYLREMLACDAFYIENRSIWLDMRILFVTGLYVAGCLMKNLTAARNGKGQVTLVPSKEVAVIADPQPYQGASSSKAV
ncbi:MAG: sugar transferase [Candidatus Eisenbacteria bacterium]|nr:sugar transferase [Candidatus Eisenbacteria bacterium]